MRPPQDDTLIAEWEKSARLEGRLRRQRFSPGLPTDELAFGNDSNLVKVKQKRENATTLEHLLYIATALAGCFFYFSIQKDTNTSFCRLVAIPYSIIGSRKSLSGLPACEGC